MLRLSSRLAMALCAAAALAAAACGKKGPPLAPVMRLPAAVDTLTTTRVGNDVYLTVTVPATNIDGTVPIDIDRVDVFGYTGTTPPPRGRLAELGTLVGTIPVTHPVPTPDGAASPTPPAPNPAAPALVGSMATVVDHLTPDELIPRLPPADVAPDPAPPDQTASRPVPATRRFYVAIGMSTRGRAGAHGTAAEVALNPLPDPPTGLTVRTTATTTELSWHAVVDPPAAAGTPPAAATPAGPAQYNVYLVARPTSEPAADTPAGWAAARPAPLNAAPLTDARFSDPAVTFGVERCYAVRSVRGTGAAQIESEPSAEQCVTALDTYPPAPPSGVIAVADPGLVSLIWEVSSEPDLAGYMVLRGTPGDATLQPLTPMAITEARFTDTTVQAGVTYVYAVVAVDTAGNASVESARVEEVGR